MLTIHLIAPANVYRLNLRMTITGGSGKSNCILISKKSKCMGRDGPCGAGAICNFEGSGIGAQGADIHCLSTRESLLPWCGHRSKQQLWRMLISNKTFILLQGDHKVGE